MTTNLEHFITIKESLAHKWTLPIYLQSPNLEGALGSGVETDAFNYLTLRNNLSNNYLEKFKMKKIHYKYKF